MREEVREEVRKSGIFLKFHPEHVLTDIYGIYRIRQFYNVYTGLKKCNEKNIIKSFRVDMPFRITT